MVVDQTNITDELTAALADLQAIAAAISATEARLAQARQADGELIALRDELGAELFEAHRTATAQTSTNAEADAAMQRYEQLLPEWQQLFGPQPGQDAGAVNRESKRLEYLRELQRRAGERVAILEAQPARTADPLVSTMQARLARLRARVQ